MAGADIAMGPRSCCIGGPELVTGADLNFPSGIREVEEEGHLQGLEALMHDRGR